MTLKNSHVTPDLHRYLVEVGTREPEIMARLREETQSLPLAVMQIPPDQAAFMALLVQLTAARRILEIGVFTGYSSLAMALAMPADGRITALDNSEEWTAVARRYWREAGVADRIDLHLEDAVESLERLLDEGAAGTFDLVFIDADKDNYPVYYEKSLALMRPGGLIAIDNAFHMGRVVSTDNRSPETEIIDQLNRAIQKDERVDIAFTPIGDGLLLCRKRS